MEENAQPVNLKLDARDLARIAEPAPPGVAAGERYPAAGMKRVNV